MPKDAAQRCADATGGELFYERVVVGVDPGTAITGYGVVAQRSDGEFVLLAGGVFRTAADQPMPARLHELYTDFVRLLDEFKPDQLAIEKLFFGRNVTTAITVGQARGVILLAAAQRGLPVAEYAPAEIKQAITGYGNAEKRQMQEMVQRILRLPTLPQPDDAADGVAVALCHLQCTLPQYHT
jgi:crossover junction endodeoxyribonuclease RuvC